MKFVLTDSSNVVIGVYDNLSGINDITGGGLAAGPFLQYANNTISFYIPATAAEVTGNTVIVNYYRQPRRRSTLWSCT
jgi:hypothetical protein